MPNNNEIYILSAPTEVCLHLTHKCNLNCLHCYIDAGGPKKEELSIEQMNKILDKLIESKVYKIYLTGGEPMLHKGFMDIIKKLYKKMWMTLATNGFYINDDNIHEISKYIKEYAVSIDGASSDSHDKFRGVKGSFQKAVNAVNIIGQNKNNTVVINTALNKLNFHEIEKIIDMGNSLGAKSVRFSTLYPKGRALNNKNIFLNNDEILNAISRIIDKNKEIDIGIGFDDSFQIPLKLYFDGSKYSREDVKCGVGNMMISVLPNGDIVPCEFFQENPEFIIGNAVRDDLKKLWKESKILNYVRKEKELKYPSLCKSCKHDQRCITIKCPALIITDTSWCNWYEKIS